MNSDEFSQWGYNYIDMMTLKVHARDKTSPRTIRELYNI